jgi:ubiquinone/menaquinone biosynthesis C-methylase UbiE
MNQWFYDEFQHCGVDYAKAAQAEAYDERHRRFRDYEKEFEGMLEFLGLRDTAAMTVVDLGCGTGAAAVLAAGRFKTVHAVDVSEAMIGQAQKKAGGNIPNLRFVNAGFLSYNHEAEPADLVMTKVALHHLPDFWKQIALLRINGMLKTGGLLYLHDVVFQFESEDYAGKIHGWIAGLEKAAGGQFMPEVRTHIRDEYSTFGWIMAGMLERAGFVVEKFRSSDEFMTEYACRKVRDVKREGPGDKDPEASL